MGRKITVDISDLLSLIRLHDCDESMQHDIFELIGDCCLRDIDEYAKTCGEEYAGTKWDFIDMLGDYIGDKTIAEMRVREGV